MHDVAGIHEAQTDAAADRRSDAGIGELKLGVVNLALIRGNGPINLANQCALSIELLLRDDALFEEKLVPLKIDLRVFALGLVFSELPKRLLKLDLEGTRIDLREKISLVNELAFLEGNADQLAVNATADGDGVEGSDGAQAIEVNGQVAALCRGNHDWHDKSTCAGTSLALAGCSGRNGGRGCLAGVPRVAVIPDTKGDNAKNEDPEPPTVLGRHCGHRAVGAVLRKVYGIELAHSFAPVMYYGYASESVQDRTFANRR